MKNYLRILGLVIVASAVTACGGGNSDSSGSSSTTSNNTTGSNTSTDSKDNVITKKCNIDNATVLVTSEGCTAFVGNKEQTILCTTSGSSKTIKMLTGTNIKYDALKNSTGGFSVGGKLSINNTNLTCV